MSSASERARQVEPTANLPDAGAVLRALVHASVLDGVVGALKVLTVTLLVDAAVTPAVGVGALATFAVYGSNKLLDDEDAVNAPDRAAFVADHRRALLAATVLAYALALALAATAGLVPLALTALPAVAAVAYSVPLPVVGGRRLKDVLGVNTLLVSVAWSLSVVGVPVAWTGTPLTPVVAVAFAFYLAQTAVAFEVRNVRDVAGDRAEGVHTLPVAFGVPATRRLLYAVDASACCLYVAAAATGVLPVAVAGAFVAATLVSVVVTARVDRCSDDGRLCLLRDANYALVLAAVALAG